MVKGITREQALDMAQAHAEGLHSPPEIAREGCPECEDRPLRDYEPYRETPKRLQGLRDYTPEAP